MIELHVAVRYQNLCCFHKNRIFVLTLDWLCQCSHQFLILVNIDVNRGAGVSPALVLRQMSSLGKLAVLLPGLQDKVYALTKGVAQIGKISENRSCRDGSLVDLDVPNRFWVLCGFGDKCSSYYLGFGDDVTDGQHGKSAAATLMRPLDILQHPLGCTVQFIHADRT